MSAFRFAMVCEDAPDWRVASTLADRILVEAVEWAAPGNLDRLRRWQAFDEAKPFLQWTEAKRLHGAMRLRTFGRFGTRPAEPYALAARKALLVLHGAEPRADAVLLVVDSDGDRARRDGLEQARSEPERHWAFTIVVGVPHPKREAWCLAGFEPGSEHERMLLRQQIARVGFSPVEKAHLLRSKRDGDVHDPKRVLSALLGGNPEREMACFHCDFEVLRRRGAESGLADFLTEVRERLAPLLAGGRAPAPS